MNNNFKVIGEVHMIDGENVISDKFKKRDFVLKVTDGNYEQFIKLELHQDRCDLVDKIRIGEDVEVEFNLRGREWNDRFFTNLVAWKVQRVNEVVSDLSSLNELHDTVNVSIDDNDHIKQNDSNDISNDLPF